MTKDVGLAALVVNYNSGAFAVSCVGSLLAEWDREGRPRERLQVVVVDNASPTDQTGALERLDGLGTRVVRTAENLGYARGMNLAYRATSGAPGDVVAVLNPDLFFLPGSLDTMIEYLLAHPECGAIDPRASVDPRGIIRLPRNLLPTPLDHFRCVLAHLNPACCRAYSRRRLRVVLPYWQVTGPVESDMLSGCCVLMRREVVEGLGRPMDDRYPLYYEDTDLFRTLTGRGLRLVHHGGARILHHWSRSAGVGGQFMGEPLRRYRLSQRAYFEKFYGRGGRLLVDAMNRVESWWPEAKSYRPMHAMEDLGVHAEPVTIPLRRRTSYVLELSMAPTFIVAGGIFGGGDRFTYPADTWAWLFQGEYFMRGFDLDTGEFLGAWRFVKPTPGRESPFTVEELAAYENLHSGEPAE
ncbi:MAG: glycosyltransferase [Planctomycetota bacterium]